MCVYRSSCINIPHTYKRARVCTFAIVLVCSHFYSRFHLHPHQVRLDSQKHIDFALNSPFGGGRPGRNKRRSEANAGKKAKGGDDAGEEAAEDDE